MSDASTEVIVPRSRGTVRLRSAGPLDAPRVELPGLRDQMHVDRLVEGRQVAVDVANRPEIRTLCLEAASAVPIGGDDGQRFVHDEAYSLPHVVGTCAMGVSPDTGAVVDASGRVHGIDGLFVVDASIIPEPPSGYPHLVTILIAERLSELMQ